MGYSDGSVVNDAYDWPSERWTTQSELMKSLSWSILCSSSSVLCLIFWTSIRRVASQKTRYDSKRPASNASRALSCIATLATAISYSFSVGGLRLSEDGSVPALWAIVALIVNFTSDDIQCCLLSIFYMSRASAGIISLTRATPQGVDISSGSLCLLPVVSLIIILRGFLRRNESITGGSPRSKTTADETVFKGSQESYFDFLTIAWLVPIISRAQAGEIDQSDLTPLPNRLTSVGLWDAIQEYPKQSSLLRNLSNLTHFECSVVLGTAFIQLFCDGMLPYISSQLLSLIDSSTEDHKLRYFVLAFLALKLSSAQLEMLQQWASRSCHQRVRGILMSSILAEILCTTDHDHDTGEMVSKNPSPSQKDALRTGLPATSSSAPKGKQDIEFLASIRNDANDLADQFLEMSQFVKTPIGLLLSIILVWRLLGPICLFGTVSLVAAQLLNIKNSKALLKAGRTRAAARDARSRTMLEFLTNIRFLRWYDFQGLWLDKVLAARTTEKEASLAFDLTQIRLRVTNMFGSSIFPTIALYLYTMYSGNRLTLDIIYPAFLLFKMLESRIREVPGLISNVTQATVAIQGLERLRVMSSETGSHRRLSTTMQQDSKPNSTLNFRGTDEDSGILSNIPLAGSFFWPNTGLAAVRSVKLTFKPGLNLVHGPVGGGKTALLLATIGELTSENGARTRPKVKYAYCSQTLWLQSLSIRDNVCFESAYSEKLYNEVIDTCELSSDLKDLPLGDLTMLGERGIGLSGGQKARIALARALYSQADVLVLDDPFSALDNDTSETIISKLVSRVLTKGRIVILATHRLDLLRERCVQLIEVTDGCVKAKPRTPSSAVADEGSCLNDTPAVPGKSVDDGPSSPEPMLQNVNGTKSGHPLLSILTYVRYGQGLRWILLVAALISSQLLDMLEIWYRPKWGNASNAAPSVTLQSSFAKANESANTTASLQFQFWLPENFQGTNGWLLGLVGISILKPCSSMVFMLAEAFLSFDASRRMFDQALRSIAGVALVFYDQIPTGDLLGRFGADLGTIDGALCGQIVRFAMFAIMFLTTIGTVIAIAPPMILVCSIVSMIVVYVFRLYQPASQKLRKLERTSYGPVLSKLSEIIEGASTIRAFKAEEHMRKSWSAALDEYQNFDRHYFALQSWLSYRIDMLTAFSEFGLIVLTIYQGRSAGMLAIGTMIARDFIDALELMCRSIKNLQTSCLSVERFHGLIQLEQEPEGTIDPGDSWPVQGASIVFEDVALEYANGTSAVRDVNLRLEHEHVVALVGRTGSGKTTLLQSLLGILSPKRGRILIDGIDISQVSKSRLRRRVTYIAQDSVLFAGTIRDNIDPLKERSDAEMLRILHEASPGKAWTLETSIDPGGSNFSLGERQIINLIRAILRKCAIVLLDEATAAIDRNCEEVIQRLIRTELKDSMIISITHRKEMIDTADRTIELANGKVIRDSISEKK